MHGIRGMNLPSPKKRKDREESKKVTYSNLINAIKRDEIYDLLSETVSFQQSVWESFHSTSLRNKEISSSWQYLNSSYATGILLFLFVLSDSKETDNSFKTSEKCSATDNCNNKRIEKFNLIPFANYHRSECRVVTKNPSGWTIGGETPYPTIPRKPTGSLIAQRNLPTFPRNPRKETKAKIEERTTFPLPSFQLP